MKHFHTLIAAGAIAAAAIAPAIAADISGAGATFPYPIYAKWADAYKKETGIGLNYQSIGSGGGIKQIKAKTVTFGATDTPLPREDLDKAGLVQFPMVMGGIVPVVNLDGIKPGELVLDGPTLAKIFLGKITKWDDPAIKKLNPSAKLPSQAIAVVHRSDGSGTTFNFTYYLSKVSPDWKSKVGANTSVEWPVGIGAKGNEGVANNVAQTKGSIGYVEYAYAKQNKLTYTKMVNKDGKTVAPTSKAFQAAAASADWKSQPGFGVILDQPAGRRLLADDGRDLHPDAQAAAGCRRPPPRRSSSSPGPTTRATRWPRSSTTSRCPTNVVDRHRASLGGRHQGRRRQAGLRDRTDVRICERRRRHGAFSCPSCSDDVLMRQPGRLSRLPSVRRGSRMQPAGRRSVVDVALHGERSRASERSRAKALDRLRLERHRLPASHARLRRSPCSCCSAACIVSLIDGSLPALQAFGFDFLHRASAGTRSPRNSARWRRSTARSSRRSSPC